MSPGNNIGLENTQQMFNEINEHRLLTKVCSNYTIKLHFCDIK
jgi:hypothetical protein